ncbi:hypothetical protein Y032_0628g834 [Ancylostoma ceylanicum]|uniref:Uncharacterized protein n=1 Tax=Ancylostoma ceylanicum TaxID=53326 RepID=A0A016WM92_9BILA|nr:hypothetical protein Y032_0628g834 [Ancylostoma ceylanicum]
MVIARSYQREEMGTVRFKEELQRKGKEREVSPQLCRRCTGIEKWGYVWRQVHQCHEGAPTSKVEEDGSFNMIRVRRRPKWRKTIPSL